MLKRSSASLLILSLIVLLAAPSTFAQDRRSRTGAKGRAGLSAGAGAGIGAGIGALLGGRRGAATGALLGGGGATAAWLLKNRDGRRRLGKYGQPLATIGAGSALGAGVGNLIDRRGKKGAAVGALLGGGASTAGYLLTRRNRNSNRYAYNNAPAYSNRYRSSARARRSTRRCRC